MAQFDVLATTRIMEVIDELQDIRQKSRDYRWTEGTDGSLGNVVPASSARIPSINALDGEILMRYTDRVTIAAIIGNDNAAPLRGTNPVRLEQTTIPKLKHGAPISEEMMVLLERIEANLSGVRAQNDRDYRAFVDYEINTLADLIDGVKARREHLAIGMLVDSFVYNSGGMKLNVTWGMPADLKPSPAVLWSDAVNATPISDIQTLKTQALQKYGINYDRISLSYQAFLYMIKTTEFRNFAPVYSQFFYNPVGVASVPVNDTAFAKMMLQNVLQMEVEFDDRQVQDEPLDASNWTAPPTAPATNQFIRFQAANTVILTAKSLDGQIMSWDIANATVQEAIPGLVPGLVGGTEAFGMTGGYGPIGYATARNLEGNPPGLALWAVQRCFPRKKALASSAILTPVY